MAVIDRARITGLVLAGGRGTRMGSVDKGLQPFRGEALVVHALRRLSLQVGEVLVSANRNHARYERFGHRVVGDLDDSFAGPLAGFEAGLAACTTDWLVSVPCDAPFFPDDLVVRLAAGLDDAGIAIARTNERAHPIFCLMRVDAARRVPPAADGRVSVGGWVARGRAVEVRFDDEAAFANLNTIADIERAERAVVAP